MLRREIILEVLTKAYIEKTQKKYLAFYYKDEVNLINITTTKFNHSKVSLYIDLFLFYQDRNRRLLVVSDSLVLLNDTYVITVSWTCPLY